ncbi:MAG: hypothetical protein FWD87_11005 [Spirochaetaceae bacterium]|nr:hypothetical protein [Spirochaetaceae bacterium]
MTGKQLEISEQKEVAVMLQKYCFVCGNHLGQAAQWAHRIPQTKANIKKWSKKVIHHKLNMRLVCSIKCNSAVALNPAANPVEATELVKKIREDLENGRTTKNAM